MKQRSTVPIGAYAAEFGFHGWRKWTQRKLGNMELHSHYRIRPMVEYFENKLATTKDIGTLRVVELGCDEGTNLFELAQRFPEITGAGFDTNSRSIERAQMLARHLFPERLRFHLADATTLHIDGDYDFLLLMDILEHIPNPAQLLRDALLTCRDGGEVVISVPTPRYPRVFGRSFALSIGHVVDGYTLEDLDAMLPPGFTRVHQRYSTGLLASFMCRLYYRCLRHLRIPYLDEVIQLLVLVLRPPDLLNGRNRSVSLFAVYRKTSSPASASALP